MFVIVMVALGVEDALSMMDIFDIISDAGADEVILKPTIGSFDFTFGLGREGVDGFDVAFFEDLFPLRVDVVGKFVKVVMELVTAFDVTKD
mgnify:CR=1 FL=1